MSTDPQRSVLELQYTEICKAHAAITDFRGKLLALFPVAASAGVLVVVRSADQSRGPGLRWAVPVGFFAFAVTFGLFLYEIRQIAECIRLRHQAAEIEQLLRVPPGIGQFRDGPALHLGVVGVELGSWVIYLTLLTTWLYIAAVAGGRTDRLLPWALVAAAVVALLGKAVQIVVRDRVWACQEPVLDELARRPAGPVEIARAIGHPERTVRATLRLLGERRLAEQTTGDVWSATHRTTGLSGRCRAERSATAMTQ
ncbi:hypothetical protein [Couchioplanes azureus]|uniref:hypothetical protein n=1 Tax=Couchioplanes caeruleus TaxID=56438 RepID=UPI001670A609|nr:hypothetical protein [Couchioplanes caeruleus]GGQ82326.1 hypothetical protein GCM10010166_60570 [Couchioplanes caeruleus subsp. azureus]